MNKFEKMNQEQAEALELVMEIIKKRMEDSAGDRYIAYSTCYDLLTYAQLGDFCSIEQFNY